MIRHSEKNGKKKNHAILREQIRGHVAKHPRYRLDLYDACVRGSLSYSAFRQFLDEMERDGEIRINANKLVHLPKPPSELKQSPAVPPTPTNEILIHCLVNRSIVLKHPQQKKPLEEKFYYAHRNYKVEEIPLNSVCEETLLKGFHFIPGTFEWLEKRTQKVDGNLIETKIHITDNKIVSNKKVSTERIVRDSDAWQAQQLFLIEFDDTTESSLEEFIAARPFLRENGWFVTESIRSRYDDPNDQKCNGQLRSRLVFCMPCVVKTLEERVWIYEALVKELPGCEKGSAISIISGGLGNANAAYIKIGKIVDRGWFKTAIETGRQKKAEKKAEQERTAESHKRKQEARAAMGFTEREGELPLEALAKSDPSLFLESLGLSFKSVSGQYQRWGRTEKQDDIALSVWQSAQENWQIRVFADSIPVPPAVNGAMSFTRFYCHHELNIDIEGLQPDSQQWKDINAELARLGYGTWLTDEEFNSQNASKKNRSYTSHVGCSVSEHNRETQEIKAHADKMSAKLREREMGVRRNTENDYTFHCLKCSESKRFRSQHPRPQKRLEIHATEQATYKEKLALPESNHASLKNAITDFFHQLESDRSDTTTIFILLFATGIGKSYVALTKTRQLGKKVFSLLFSHGLAAEQTNIAAMLGYNAFRFKGRSYNFENSNLSALPLQLRELNESLFRSEDVMCPVYDKLEPYHEKRINPYMLCFSCPLLDACKSEGYWSQFPELRHADYLSACIQDILFNPDFWTLLDTFLTGSVPFQEPETDEEAAIATMLDLQENEEITERFQPFDFAMIDDYTTAGLYSEAHYTLEEISKLKKAWAGTPTGNVLNQVFDAILLLYDPDGTQRSVDILTQLFDSLDEETKDTVNTNLTKHANRDEYGDVLPTAPWTALRKGLASLDTLTPVWHSKDWTLLHQLETIIKHCQNTAQAPMFIDTDGNITLSIPPQVHPKIKAVLLMSATADIPSTKNAFRRQPVTFTTSEGKPSHWAKGVKGFQYVGARWTTQSIFELQKDDDGKTVYDDDGSPIIVGLRPKTVEMLQKLTELARNDSRKCVFISYKEFVEGEIAELEVVKQLHEAFDTVTHYDIAPGMNFEGYKIFVTFGYPKVKWSVIEREARKQYAHEPERLNFDYTTTTEQEEVYSSTHRRFTDPRVENIRQQLTTHKLQQGNGRARHTRWEDTITIAFCAEPIPGFTELATPFTDEDWRNTESFDLDAAIEANATRSIKDIAEQDGVSERTAYRKTEKHRSDAKVKLEIRIRDMKANAPEMSNREIAKALDIHESKVRRVLRHN